MRTLSDGTHVAAAQRLSERNEEILVRALTAAAPILILTPVMLLVLILVLWHGLKPVQRLVKEIQERKADDLSSLSYEGVPEELERIMTASTICSLAWRNFEGARHGLLPMRPMNCAVQ